MNTQHLPRKPALPATGRALSGKLPALLAASSVLALASAQAQLIKYEDFESYTDGQVLANNGTTSVDGWTKGTNASNRTFNATVLEESGGNKYLLQDKGGAAGGPAVVLQPGSGFGATTADDGFQTLFFRFQVSTTAPNDSNPNNKAGFGIGAATDSGNPFNPKAGFDIDGNGQIFNSNSSTTVGTALDPNVWYNAWFAVDHRGTQAGSTAELWVQSDSDANYATQTLVGSTFYNNIGASAYDIIYFNSENISGPAFAVDDIFYDNTGKNLVNPIPEPSSAVLISGLVAGAMLLRRRRR